MKYETMNGKNFRHNLYEKGIRHIIFTDEVSPKEGN